MTYPVERPSTPPHEPIAPPSGAEWPAQATDTVVSLVDKVRDSTTGRILTVARAIVFGLIAAVLGTMVGVLGVVFGVRLVTELLLLTGWDWIGVWATYLLFGLVFCLAGAVVFRKRHSAAG
jgi:hypothetical protein